MAQIPSWLWLISGIAIIFFSKYMGGKVELFFWAGLVFAIVGIAKILVGYILHKGETKSEEIAVNAPFYPSANAAAPVQSSVMRFCSRCGSQVHPSSYFCHKCGLRLR
jgi:hypothetical protein